MGVQEEQAAFYAGAQWARDTVMERYRVSLAEAKEEAARRYPIPAVEELARAGGMSTEKAADAIDAVTEAFVWPAHSLTPEEYQTLLHDDLYVACRFPTDLLEAVTELTPIWTTDGMQADFEAVGFQAPYVLVKRRDTGQEGTLKFTHRPRYYYGWVPA